jgi:simple sugar transport system ATP-binding protein
MAEVFLSMKETNKRYGGVKALDGVDFEIFQGEIHCLVGENGSGKSTLIKIISGAVDPDEGTQIEISGKTLHGYQAIDAIHQGIEVIYQDLSLFPNLTVAENIAISEFIAGGRRWVNWKELEQIARTAMARIDVSLPLDELVADISIADQQIVTNLPRPHSRCKAGHHGRATASLAPKKWKLSSLWSRTCSRRVLPRCLSATSWMSVANQSAVTILRDGKRSALIRAGSWMMKS